MNGPNLYRRKRTVWFPLVTALSVSFAWSLSATDPQPIDLATALRLAGASNLDVEIARERVNEARAASDAARARFFPWVAPSIVVRRHEENVQDAGGRILDADKQSLAAGLAINAQLDLGETYFQNLVAKQVLKSTEAAFAGRQREATFRAAAGFFELMRARAAVIASEEAARVAGLHAAQIGISVEAGLSFKGDASRARAAHERAELVLLRARTDQRIAAARLAEILRLDPSVELIPDESTLAPMTLEAPGDDLGDRIARALAKRPEMDESAARLAGARLNRRAATQGPLIPTLGAQASIGGLGGGPAGSTLTRDFDMSSDLSFGVSWRIGPGGLLDRNRQREMLSREKQMELEREKVSDAIRRQVVESHARLQSLGQQVELARKSLEAADLTVRLSRGRRETGVSAAFEDLEAEEELARTRRDYLATIADYNLAQYALRFATGD